MKKQILFQKDFTLVVIGQIISLFGNAILRFALPLYLLRETGSPSLFGAVTACSFIPMIIFSLFGGVLADRVNKRNIMVILDFGTAAIIAVFYLIHGILPIVPIMIVCLMLLYSISGAYQPAVQASIPALLENEQIMRGNAVINMVNTLASLLGPIIGGILFGAWGLVPILLVSTACFLSSAVMEIFIHIPFKKRKSEKSMASIVLDDLKESGRYIKNEKPEFVPVIVILALFNLIFSSVMIVGIPIMVVNILQMSDISLGITQGALGLGGLAGGLLGGIIGGRLKLKNGYLLLAGCSVSALVMGIGLFSFVPPLVGYWLITGMSFAAMALSTMFTIQMCSMVQQQTPSHLIGKIMALIMAVANCAAPAGQAMYGLLFDVCSMVPWAIMLGAAVVSIGISLYSKKCFLNLRAQTDNIKQSCNKVK